ncbi:MAG: phospho-N-acetylmuramoyl-pentapeptide-transferase [Chloroflexi bacterium]|nr:phospho-N-acetylmuramoyl-pentapeptide-transferase [Chloroflexota bacterium]
MAWPLTLGTIAFLFAVLFGGWLIRWLKQHRIGKQIRIEEPDAHQTKTGTPTMGGIMILVPVALITIVLNSANFLGNTLIGRSVLVPVATMLTFGILGALDDLAGLRSKNGNGIGIGLSARQKFLVQTLLAVAFAFILRYGMNLRSVAIPTIPEKIDLGIFYIPIAMFFVVGFSNAVNLTDGLDSLAGWTAAIAFACYGMIAFLQGQAYLAVFCFTLVGALLAFLWYNAHPAELFMGDTGALALGATLAVVALMTGQWLLLPLIGIVFVAETVSVILQVAFFKITKGKRIFKMAPVHLHFEMLGWSETQVVQRFWLAGLLAGMLGIALALL